MSIGLLVVTVMVLHQVGWEKIIATVEQHHGAGGFNPITNPNLGWTYCIMQVLGNTAAALTWQTQIARVLAAKDSRTGRRVYTGTSFFFVCRFLIPGIWGIAALAILTPAAFSVLPDSMMAQKSLYAMPIFLSQIVPVGLMGLLIAAMLAADMSTDSSYMLAWGSVIYNDIMAPFRKGTWSDRKGLLWNRFIVACIGVFLLVWGLWYKLEGNLWDYLQLTGTIYLASMSVLLIAACYWKRANSWGATASIIVAAAIPITFLILEKTPASKDFAKSVGPYTSGIAAYVSSALAMIIFSLLKPRKGEEA